MTDAEQSPEGIQSTDYFADVPLWTSDSTKKRFEVMSDEISGRIPATRVESWRAFLPIIEDPFFCRTGVRYVYRGHRRFDWGLTPSLGRLTENEIVTKELSDEQLAKFRHAIRGRIDDRALLDSYDDNRQCDELWAVGQHHGLMTPLLDWTYSPYVALFFAFAKADVKGEETDNPYRVVYFLNKTFVEDEELCPEIRVLEPRKDDYGRLVNQAGLFTFSPYDSTIENMLSDVLSDPEFGDDTLRNSDEDTQPGVLAGYICKVYIRNDDRDGCLRHLRRMNVHHASLFPDLLGAADYCNILAEEESKERLVRKQEMLFNLAVVPISAELTAPHVEGQLPLEAGATPEVEKVISAHASIDNFEVILSSPPQATQVEPGRLKAIVSELAKAFAQEKAVDWKDRETVQARLRVVAKVTLRKFGYPAEIRDTVAEQLVAYIVAQE